MLINCPRCGFSQPNDQYCAQCGVDMQSYKPKEKPLFNRIIENTSLQISVLLFSAVLVGQYILHSREPQSWVHKITHFNGIIKSEKSKSADQAVNDMALVAEEAAPNNASSSSGSSQLESIRNREITLGRSGEQNPAGGGVATSASVQSQSGGAQDLSSVNFKITYAEINREALTKWIAESSNLGLYQNLEQYSAGIIYDFKKHSENYQQKLKSADLKLALGSSNSNLSGIVNEDGSQMLGLVTSVEYKSNENEIIHGTITVTHGNGRTNEVYPAEFALPKGSAFFLIGALKRGISPAERSKLDMPPYQIFKSSDFMTRKTEFVIILEPDYK